MKYLLIMSALILSSCNHRPMPGNVSKIPDHIPGISCPASDGSHGPCPFGCTAEQQKAWKGWLISR